MILTNYWWLILWPILMGPILALTLPKTEVSVFGITLERWPLVAVWILVLPYIFWCMNRSEFADTEVYRSFWKYRCRHQHSQIIYPGIPRIVAFLSSSGF